MKEAESYRARVASCEEANSLFRSTPNATIRETVTKTTADLPEALRKVLDDTPIGHLTAPEPGCNGNVGADAGGLSERECEGLCGSGGHQRLRYSIIAALRSSSR